MGDASLDRREWSRRDVLIAALPVGAVSSLLFDPAPAWAAPESWDAWVRRMSTHSAARRPLSDPGRSGNGECTHLWRDFLVNVVGAPWGAGQSGSYAHHLWTNYPADPEAQRALIRVGRSSAAQRGDGVVWASDYFPPAPHVAVVVDDLGDSLRIWTQNQNGHRYPERLVFSKGPHLHGYLRSRTAIEPPPSNGDLIEGDEMYILRDAASGAVYLLTANGRVGLTQSAHIRLFERMFRDRAAGNSSSFTASELSIIRNYILRAG